MNSILLRNSALLFVTSDINATGSRRAVVAVRTQIGASLGHKLCARHIHRTDRRIGLAKPFQFVLTREKHNVFSVHCLSFSNPSSRDSCGKTPHVIWLGCCYETS